VDDEEESELDEKNKKIEELEKIIEMVCKLSSHSFFAFNINIYLVQEKIGRQRKS
jgi:hypothetical protein